MSDWACSVCQKAVPLPALICTMCTETPTYDCDTKCRDRHQTRQIVYRTGALRQGIFYAFREVAFDIKIKKVEKIGGKLHVYEDSYTDDKNDGPLYRFPAHMLPDDEDKAKLLVFSACNDAFAYTFELAATLLRDISATIEEVNIDNVNRNDTIVKYVSTGIVDGTPYGHNAIIVDIKPELGGKSYAFDLAGAQNGQLHAVVPFGEFANKGGEVISQIHPHGYFRDLGERIRQGKQSMLETREPRVYHVQHNIHQRMLAAVKEWEGENKTSLRKLVRSTSKGFIDGKASLLARVSTEMKASVVKWEQEGRHLEPFTPLVVSFAQLLTEKVEECTVKPQGGGSRAYRRFQADKKRRGRFPASMKEFTTAEGTTFKFL
ncbi:hypothetical protein M409DRAFT_16740 [Zasmidium cellare ATCC 36951]|uniref:MYND-type zinc finger protein samB n=1 Tax=Zasmidium cellare ATCC 36951 TaxID=1080233 RepID=A0A6A6D3R9_ZASCE|nr:uncharacterized protein M409DRAFT_16740 [Zasmidium cellare ATCC 36951]KAF2172779.1 hypothetical protein M409DRAFT_16740 [Zasmidium cellare ATCC 36951]